VKSNCLIFCLGLVCFLMSVVVSSALTVDVLSRESVRSFYNNTYLDSEGTAIDWTGSHASCDEGDTATAFKNAVLRRENYFRVMAGIPEVILNSTYSAGCQKAALMMSRNNDLDHSPTSSWYCYSAEGAAAAGTANLSLGTYGWDSVNGQMRDSGSGNAACGHRRWILYPQTEETGTGSVPSYDSYPKAMALRGWDDNFAGSRPAVRDTFVSWPSPGYVPYPVVFGRWSFSYPSADFSSATVTMTENGSGISTVLEPLTNGFGENTIVWRPNGVSDSYIWPQPVSDMIYTVTVANVMIGGSPESFTYAVTIMDPATSGPSVPSVPMMVRASNGTYTNFVLIQWDVSEDAEYYEVWRNSVNESEGATCLVDTAVYPLFFDLYGVPEQLYYYFVRAGNDDGLSDFGVGNSGYAAMAAPSTPSRVQASDGVYTNKIRITWEGSAGAVTYQLWRNDSNTLSGSVKIYNIGAHLAAVPDTNITSGVTMYYWMRAHNQGGFSGFSDSDSGYAAVAQTAPATPENVYATDGLYTDRIVVSWDVPAGATGFDIWRHTSSLFVGATQIRTNEASASYVDIAVTPGLFYYYWIRARNAIGHSGISEGEAGYAEAVLPSAPSVWATEGTYFDHVAVVWQRVSAVTGYEVWRNIADTTSGATRLSTLAGWAGSYDDYSVTPGETNYFFVRGTNSNGAGSFSDSAMGYALLVPIAPSNLVASDGDYGDRVTLGWNSGSGSFDIWRSTNSSLWTASCIRSDEFTVGYADITIEPGILYYYWITIEQGGLTSDFSNGDSGYASSPVAPPAPGVTASKGTYTNLIRIAWQNIPIASGFDIWRDLDDNEAGATQIGTNLPGYSYDDMTPLVDEGYYYWVRSVSGYGTSSWSQAAFGYRTGPLASPDITAIQQGESGLYLNLTNLTVGVTNFVQTSTNLLVNTEWISCGALIPSQNSSDWYSTAGDDPPVRYYRVTVDPSSD